MPLSIGHLLCKGGQSTCTGGTWTCVGEVVPQERADTGGVLAVPDDQLAAMSVALEALGKGIEVRRVAASGVAGDMKIAAGTFVFSRGGHELAALLDRFPERIVCTGYMALGSPKRPGRDTFKEHRADILDPVIQTIAREAR